jgi:hypothetical protein
MRGTLERIGRALTIGLYATAIALAVMLSDRPAPIRAGAGAAWVVCVGLLAWAAIRSIGADAAGERGWARQRAGLCARCAYPVARGTTTCPECGRIARMPPL